MKEADDLELSRIEQRIDELADLLVDGETDEVIRGSREVVERCRGLPDEARDALTIEATLLIGDAHTARFEDDEALRAYAAVLEIEPDAPEALYGEGRLRFLRWEFERAAVLFKGCDGAPPDIAGPARYHEAVLAQFEGRDDDATRMFQEAEALDPDGCPRPIPSTEQEVLALLDDTVALLPDDVTAALDNVVFDVVDLPDLAVVGKETAPTTLGLYTGSPISEAHNSVQFLPTTIHVFRKNIERIAHDRDHLMEELRVTILHEIGHHLGWDDHDLEERGLG